jgi:hypothetical protein
MTENLPLEIHLGLADRRRALSDPSLRTGVERTANVMLASASMIWHHTGRSWF